MNSCLNTNNNVFLVKSARRRNIQHSFPTKRKWDGENCWVSGRWHTNTQHTHTHNKKTLLRSFCMWLCCSWARSHNKPWTSCSVTRKELGPVRCVCVLHNVLQNMCLHLFVATGYSSCNTHIILWSMFLFDDSVQGFVWRHLKMMPIWTCVTIEEKHTNKDTHTHTDRQQNRIVSELPRRSWVCVRLLKFRFPPQHTAIWIRAAQRPMLNDLLPSKDLTP